MKITNCWKTVAVYAKIILKNLSNMGGDNIKVQVIIQLYDYWRLLIIMYE